MDILLYLKNIQETHPDFLNWISLFTGVIGIFLSIVLYLKSKPLKLLAYANRMFMVITDRSMRIGGLEVTVHGRTTPVVTVNRIAIWNAGNRTIFSEDLSKSDPIIIGPLHNAEVFEIAILEQTKISNQANFIDITNNPNSHEIKFDYLDPGDGILINVVHNGDALEEFKISGSIKGGSVKKRGSYPESVIANPKIASIEGLSGGEVMSRRLFYRVLSVTSLVVSILFLLMFLGKDGRSIALVTSFFSLFVGGMFFTLAKKHSPPPKLKKFDDVF